MAKVGKTRATRCASSCVLVPNARATDKSLTIDTTLTSMVRLAIVNEAIKMRRLAEPLHHCFNDATVKRTMRSLAKPGRRTLIIHTPLKVMGVDHHGQCYPHGTLHSGVI